MTLFKAEQERADYRAGLIAAMILNAQRSDSDDKVWTAADFFPSLQPEEEEEEMTTAETVEYLRRGFSLFVPPEMRERVGLH